MSARLDEIQPNNTPVEPGVLNTPDEGAGA